MARCARQLGETFAVTFAPSGRKLVMISDPEAVKTVMTAPPDVAPSGAANSPLASVVGPNSVLILIGERHMRQRKLLLPPFHGERMREYEDVIVEATRRDMAGWPLGRRDAPAGAHAEDHARGDPARRVRCRGRQDARAAPGGRRAARADAYDDGPARAAVQAGPGAPAGSRRARARPPGRGSSTTSSRAAERSAISRSARTYSRCCCRRPTKRARGLPTSSCAMSS